MLQYGLLAATPGGRAVTPVVTPLAQRHRNLPELIASGPGSPPSQLKPRLQAQAVTKGTGFTSTRVFDENTRLKQELNAERQKNVAMLRAMYHSGLGSFDEFVILGYGRRGPKIKEPSKKKAKLRAAAADALTLMGMIQGPDVGQNVVQVAKLAIESNPLVRDALMADGCFPEEMEKKPAG